MARQRRDRDAEQASIRAAGERLLAGTPPRSSGELTVSALITESGLRRDVVYEHAGLIDEFKARVKAQQSTPLAMQRLAGQDAEATRKFAELKAQLAAERAAAAVMRKMVAELSLELEQARQQLAAGGNVYLLSPTADHAAAPTSPKPDSAVAARLAIQVRDGELPNV